MHPIRRVKAWAIWRVIKLAVKRLPPKEREKLMEFIKSLFQSKAQIAKVITIIASTLTGLHLMPQVVPLLGDIAAAIQAGDIVAIIVAVIGIIAPLVSLFERHAKDVKHAESLAMQAMLAGQPPAATVAKMRASLRG